MERAPCIEVVNLSKVYRDPMRIWRTINGITDLSFSLEPGEIVGFVGHNGAGKTTTIKMLMGFIAPTAGRIGIFGADPGDRDGRNGSASCQSVPIFTATSRDENSCVISARFPRYLVPRRTPPSRRRSRKWGSPMRAISCSPTTRKACCSASA